MGATLLHYDDLQDLIQNQRALAQMVYGIDVDYTKIEEDIAYVKEIEQRIAMLDANLTAKLEHYDQQFDQSDQAIRENLETVRQMAEELKINAEHFANVASSTRDFAELLDELYYIKSFRTEWADTMDRIDQLEIQCHSIILMEPGNEIPVSERRPNVYYGKITDEVRDVMAGQAIRLGPNLQGVVQ